MTEDQDNASEVVAGAVRVALTAAGQLAEQAARRREADLREAERESAARVATLQSQSAAERELALRSVRDVVQRGDAATVEEIVRAWEQARCWEDPAMGIERAQLEDRIRDRFGVDAPRLAVGRFRDEKATAAALSIQDMELQVSDGGGRNAGRAGSERPENLRAGIDDEAAAASALAAKSHPVPAGEALQSPRANSGVRRQGRRTLKTAELQVPGR